MFPRRPSPSDRSSFFFRVRRYLPQLPRARRREHLSTKVFTSERRMTPRISTKHKFTATISILALTISTGVIFFSGIFTIKKVSVLRSSLDLPLAEIELLTREKAFRKNIFLLDVQALASEIQATRPDISRVRITKQLPAALSVEVVKYPIVAQVIVGTERIYINENGYRVDGQQPDRDTFTLAISTPVDLEDRALQLVSPTHLATMRDAKFYFESITERDVAAVRYLPAAREAHLLLPDKTTIWLDLAADYRTQLDKLTAAGKALDITKAYQHIDLRIRDKIFYATR